MHKRPISLITIIKKQIRKRLKKKKYGVEPYPRTQRK